LSFFCFLLSKSCRTEKDLMPFMKKRFPEIVQGVKIEEGTTWATITKLEKIEGTMDSLNRKGKPIFLYELTLKLNWEGATIVDGKEVKATGSVDYTDIDQDEDPYSVSVKSEKEERNHTPIKELIRKKSGPKIKAAIAAAVQEAKASISGVSTPEDSTKRVITEPDVAVKIVNGEQVPTRVGSVSTLANSIPASSKGSKTIRQKIIFDIVIPPLFETFTDERRVSAFTGGHCKIGNSEGSQFSMFGGSVVGTLVNFIPNSKIVQKWRFQSWPENHYSTVTWEFNAQGDKTELVLTQTDVPQFDYERTLGGWEEFFWSRVRGLFGWHYKLTK